jgi:hypothetical protein
MKWYHYLFGHKKRMELLRKEYEYYSQKHKQVTFQKMKFSKTCEFIVGAN